MHIYTQYGYHLQGTVLQSWHRPCTVNERSLLQIPQFLSAVTVLRGYCRSTSMPKCIIHQNLIFWFDPAVSIADEVAEKDDIPVDVGDNVEFNQLTKNQLEQTSCGCETSITNRLCSSSIPNNKCQSLSHFHHGSPVLWPRCAGGCSGFGKDKERLSGTELRYT